MRILHVIPGLTQERGGPTTVVCALARHQAAAGHEVSVLYTDQGARTGETPASLPAGVASERASIRGPNRLAYAPRFAEILRRHLRACDIVHVHSIFTHPVHVTLREAARAGVPAILRPCGHLHHYSLHRSRRLKRGYLALWGNWVRRSVACWHYTSEQEAAESWPGGNPPHFVLPNGIEPGDFAVDRAKARAHVARTCPALGDAPYVLFLARFHPKKRLDLLLEAFLAGAPRDYRLVVAGPDECGLWPDLAARFLAGPDAARVVRLGTVGGPDKVALLAGATLFALPSEHENFGNAALEALATGTPALLSPHVDLTGPSQQEPACFRAPLAADAWAGRLAELLADASALGAAAESLRRAVQARYAWRRLADELAVRYAWVRAGCPANEAAPAPTAVPTA